jgi:hypothetical protein
LTTGVTGTLPVANGGTGITSLGSGVATFLATPSSANLAAAVSDETGTGALVFANSPTLVTPALGTPSSGTVTNLTGTASININGTVGATTASTGAFTTLAASGDVTLSGGTANGVAFANGSKVLTTGSALTYNGSRLTIGGVSTGAAALLIPAGDILADVSSGAFAVGNYGDSSSELRLSTRGFTAFRTGATDGTNGSEAMRLTSTSLYTASGINVGIGTSSPGAKLDISANGEAIAFVRLTNTQASGRTYSINNGFPSVGALSIYDNTAAATRVVLDSSGNLGLGVPPSAWYLGYATQCLEIGRAGGFAYDIVDARTYVLNNAYKYTTSTWKYRADGFAGTYGISDYDGAHRWYTAPSGTAGDAISFTQSMTLDASGQLGIGSTSPTQVLTIAQSGNFPFIHWNNSSNTNIAFAGWHGGIAGNDDFRIGTAGAKVLAFQTNNTERARITSGGYFKSSDTGSYIGATGTYSEFRQSDNNHILYLSNSNASITNSALFIVDANRNTTDNTFYAMGYYNTAAGAYKFRVADSGNVTNTNNSYGAISDAKLKENVTDATPKLEKLNQVRIVNFNMIGDEQKQIGVIAQELEQVFPGMVDESPDRDKDGNDLGTTTKSVKYSVFVPMLIKALQEATTEINSLKARLDAANL